MSSSIKWLSVGALLAVGIGAVYVSTIGLGGTQAATAQYLTQAAQLSTVARVSAATGSVASADAYSLSFGAAAQLGTDGASSDRNWTVDDVLVSVGDPVSQGATLAIATTDDLERDIELATTSLELAQLKLADAQQALGDAKTDTKRQLTDAKTAITAAELAVTNAKVKKNEAEDVGGATLRSAKIGLIQAEDKLRSAKQLKSDLQDILDEGEYPAQTIAISEAEEAVAALEAEISDFASQLDLASIVAPADGVVTAVHIKPGFDAPAGSAIEMDSDVLQVVADVVESDVPSMAIGQSATINIGALEQSVTGMVTSVAPTTDGSSDSVVTYPVTVTLDAPETSVLPGMSTDVEIIIAEAPGVIAVPAVALAGRADNRSVQVLLPDGSVEQRQVTVGLVNETLAEIQAGVLEGEEVVIGTISEKQEAEAAAAGLVGGQVPGARALQGGGTRGGGGGN